MMCSFLFGAFVFYLQRSFFVCSIRFLFAVFLLFAVLVFYLQRTFSFAAFLFCLQRFSFVCSMSLVGHRSLQHSFFVCSVSFICSSRFLFAAYFFICSVSFLFAAFFFCLQRFFFVCSMSLVGHRTDELVFGISVMKAEIILCSRICRNSRHETLSLRLKKIDPLYFERRSRVCTLEGGKTASTLVQPNSSYFKQFIPFLF